MDLDEIALKYAGAPMIINIAGDIGAGKSTVAKLLAKKLGYNHRSGGDFMRAMAKEQGKTLMELSKEALTNPEIDQKIDAYIVNLGKTEDNFVIDSRLGFHFIPQSISVYLSVEPMVGAQRIWRARRPDEQENTTLESTYENVMRRRERERQRYTKAYRIDPEDKNHYAIKIDTTRIPPEQVAQAVLKAIDEHTTAQQQIGAPTQTFK